MPLYAQLAPSTLVTPTTVLAHLLGLAVLMRLVRGHHKRISGRSSLVRDGLGVAGAAAGLFALHPAEIRLYAMVHAVSGARGSLGEALHFSTSTYTTVGYGDVVLPKGWRVFGAIEGANGIILLGWSTAFFVSVVGRIRLMEAEAEKREVA